MSDLITRRRVVLAAGASALAAVPAGCALSDSTVRTASLKDAGTQATKPLSFNEIWPADPANRPACGYNRAALLLFTLGARWRSSGGDNSNREAAKAFISATIKELAYLDPAATPEELPPAETEAGKVFRELWSGRHKNNRNREIGFRPMALNAARFGYAPPGAQDWTLMCDVSQSAGSAAAASAGHALRILAMVTPAEPTEALGAMQDKDNPEYDPNGLAPQEKEEVEELIDELP